VLQFALTLKKLKLLGIGSQAANLLMQLGYFLLQGKKRCKGRLGLLIKR